MKMPSKDENILIFNNLHKQILAVPFVIYADFQAITEKIQGCHLIIINHILKCIKTYSRCCCGYKVVCCYDDKYSKPIQINKGKNAVYKFWKGC